MQLLLKTMSSAHLSDQLVQEHPFQCSSAKPDELSQLCDFLKSCCHTALLNYPLSIWRDRDVGGVPDFTFEMPHGLAAVELTRLSGNQLEKSRCDQANGAREGKQLGARAVTSLQVSDSKRTLVQRRAETLIPSADTLFVPWQEVEDAWLACVIGQIDTKTRSMARPRYRVGDEGWLLLEDRLSSSQAEMERRLPCLRDALETYWSNDRRTFQKVFLQPRERCALFMLSTDCCGEVA